MSILVVAEHTNRALSPVTRAAVTAARAIDADVQLLVAGSECSAAADQAASIEGVSTLLVADQPCYQAQLPEQIALLVQSIADRYTHILAPATSNGKGLIPRLAALLDVEPLSDVTAVLAPDLFQRPIYAGNALATFRSRAPIKLLNIRASAFDLAPTASERAPRIELDLAFETDRNRVIGERLAESERPELASASIVVSGGRGLGSAEDFELIYRLADRLGAAVGASRAAVDAGFVANDLQVGQTGKVVAPDLYIAVGISGAIQHLAGMKDSKVIVAINKDPDAPIFEVADYGLVADLFDAVPELLQKL